LNSVEVQSLSKIFETKEIGFGLLFAGLTMRIRSYNTISNLVFFGYMVLTGALFPISVIPAPFRYLCMIIPFTYFNDLVRHAALATPTILPGTLEYAIAMLLSVCMLLVGFVGFKKIEDEARMRGTIASS
jgi:ABC-2 type transport system permease protein